MRLMRLARLATALPAPRRAALACALACASAPSFGCGGDDDDESAPPPPSQPVQPARPPTAIKPTATGAPGEKGPLTTYMHVEERMTSEAERATIRHQFKDGDFTQDADGENRDPFRSFLLDGLPDQRPGLTEGEGTPTCSPKQMVATSYSIRDLKLVGIVSRGLKRYALMQDTANFGQIVTRGDCIGKEKALVKEIGAGYMTLAVMPDTLAAGAPAVAQERSIPLYPEELPMTRSSDDDEDSGSGVMPPVVLPPSAPRPAPGAAGASGAATGATSPAPSGKPAPAAPPPAEK
jgi:Tfp pilus assembly protein PilP